ncbi:unnamed protein product [Staurois parvus]|uniref:Uncharacterized protein n=1 Tax=Staurois parvus TaxID=386267 RepID=A0ABN9CWV4_9NEOB|nr:unnamed protein product [Staurois parvus]
MGPPDNRESCGPCVLAQTQKSLLKRYQGHLMGLLTDPGPSGRSLETLSPRSSWGIASLQGRGGLTTHGAPGQ